jgi:hypothetical protein
MQLGGSADFLHNFIWSHVSGLMRFRYGECIKFWQYLGKTATETLAVITEE